MHTRPNLAGGEYRNISAWAIRNPIPICMLFLLLTLAGIVAFPTLRINNSPDLDLPAVVVAVAQAGAGPSEIETLVTRRIEDAISGLGNVRHVTSAVLDGASPTVVEFVLGKDINSAVTEVRDRMAQIRADLPAGLRDPVVTHIEAAGGAILTYAVSAPDRGDKTISRFIDDTITKTLLFIPGVAQVTRSGGVDREIRIALKPDRIRPRGHRQSGSMRRTAISTSTCQAAAVQWDAASRRSGHLAPLHRLTSCATAPSRCPAGAPRGWVT
jgi:multidrug efflux pump subunit AcrB